MRRRARLKNKKIARAKRQTHFITWLSEQCSVIATIRRQHYTYSHHKKRSIYTVFYSKYTEKHRETQKRASATQTFCQFFTEKFAILSCCYYIHSMNNLIDIVNKWANRLTVRILVLAGVSQASINRVVAAMNERQNIVNQSDKKIRGAFVWLKWLIVTILVAASVYIALNFRTLIKRFK